MREQRSASQILFGFLPSQTVDLRRRVWRVTKWERPLRIPIDAQTLQRELRKHAAPWAAAGRDQDYLQRLARGRAVKVLSLNRQDGVRVESFPDVWMCRACRRIPEGTPTNCPCGSRSFGQLPFVGYHDCGALRAPFIPRCPQHNDVEVVFPGTSSAAEILFKCPACDRTLRKGFGFPNCACGAGKMTFNVHRAASVYTPRTLVLVNPPSPEQTERLLRAGGPARALAWLVEGATERSFEQVKPTRATFLQQLLDQQMDPAFAEQMADQAEAAGQLASAAQDLQVPEANREEIESQAVTVGLALSESRITLSDLIDGTDPWSELGSLYRDSYPAAMGQAALESVELLDRFPVLTGNYGFTRGRHEPGESTLNPFQDDHGYVVYGDLAQTEALFVRLKPTRVAAWLRHKGFHVNSWTDDRTARLAVLQAVTIPDPGDQSAAGSSAGASLLTLIHSFAHKLIRRTALLSGIDRNALSELLVPYHLGFFVYAAARGDFVLGGLQAMFETELSTLLRDLTHGESRCPLDPGCQRSGGACMACLHLGEPSCRYYNGFLDRSTLTGIGGYLTSSWLDAADSSTTLGPP